jgi:hypothetical protein
LILIDEIEREGSRMSLYFNYKRLVMPKPQITLGGGRYRAKPIISITLVGPGGALCREALVDSGADECIFPEQYATTLGINLQYAPFGSTTGIGGNTFTVRYAEVTLRLASHREQREWRAWIAFTISSIRRPLLGIAGFLQFFDAKFCGEREEIELTVNGTYPGT